MIMTPIKIIIGFMLLLILFFLLRPIYETIRNRTYKRYRFNTFITFFYIIFLALFLLLVYSEIINIQITYILGVSFVYYVTTLYIAVIRDIKEKHTKFNNNETDTINEYEFFIYLMKFSLIMIFYIGAFAIFYLYAIPLGQNYFDGWLEKDNVITPLSFGKALYYSGHSFFISQFDNIQAKGILILVTLSEYFVAQIVLIMFIGVLASMLFEMLKLNRVRRGTRR